MASAPVRFGSPLYRYDTIASTQDVAREWAERGAGPGTVVIARQMSQARGRLGRVWTHPPGANVGLTALAPPVPSGDVWQVALVAGLAVCAAVNAVAPAANARVRFPNDVYAQGRKVSGVLVEAAPHATSGFLSPLVGIGINVRRVPMPPELAERAISIEEACGASVALADVEAALLESLTRCWEQWQQQGFSALLGRWHEQLDPAARRAFVVGGETVLCRVQGVSPDGDVSLEADGGKAHHVQAAHVLFGEE